MKFPSGYTIALLEDREISKKWPNLNLDKNGNAKITSLKNLPMKRYNCLGFALGYKTKILDMSYLSTLLNLEECGVDKNGLDWSINAHAKVISHFYKFEICYSEEWEKDFTKIALYEGISYGEKIFVHAAILMPNGIWKSKLGDYEDIEHHTLEALQGDFYGRPSLLMKRHKNNKSKPF